MTYQREVQAEMLVRELAASNPIIRIEAPLRKAENHCSLCDKRDKVDGFQHRPSCLWLKALGWVADVNG